MHACKTNEYIIWSQHYYCSRSSGPQPEKSRLEGGAGGELRDIDISGGATGYAIYVVAYPVTAAPHAHACSVPSSVRLRYRYSRLLAAGLKYASGP